MQQLNEAGTLVPRQVWDGVTVRFIAGDRMTLAIAELAPNAVVPRHVHENEQLGVVIQGSARFITDTDSRELRAGATYRLLSNVPHQVEAGPEGAVSIECFAPIRSDWELLASVPEAALRWPCPAGGPQERR